MTGTAAPSTDTSSTSATGTAAPSASEISVPWTDANPTFATGIGRRLR